MKQVLFALIASVAATAVGRVSWAGLYRKADGSIIGIGELHEFGRAEVLVDYSTGEAGQLLPPSGARTGVGHAIGDSSPPPTHELARRGEQLSLDGQPLHRIAVRREEFKVNNGPIKLAGELVRTTQKPRGVIVVVHGSGDGQRHAYDIWTNLFLSRGWAVVVYDKRGSGASTGDWHDADFTTLAGDVRRVLRWTRARPELKGLKVGLWGVSQAGWIIPQVAAEGAVDFAIVQAGPSTPANEFVSRTLESELRAYGFSPDEIACATRTAIADIRGGNGEDIDLSY